MKGRGVSDSKASSTQGLRDVFVVLRSSLDGDGRSSTTGSAEAAGSLRCREFEVGVSSFDIQDEAQPGADVNARKSELHKAIENGNELDFFTRVRESGQREDFQSLQGRL